MSVSLSLSLSERQSKYRVINLGTIDWYIDAIISYQLIHYGKLKKETKYSHEQMANLLAQYTFSADSKKPVGNNYFMKMNEQKLASIFPYLYSYVNNDYFHQKYVFKKDKRASSNTDISKFQTLPEGIDIFTYSFPCQDLSQQGKQRGLTKETRSGLLYQVERILKQNKDRLPKVLVLENVKALASQKFIHQFEDWLNTLKKLGYKSYWKVINAADMGSAQNRERVFAISILKDKLSEEFEFPQKVENGKSLKDIIRAVKSNDKRLNLAQKYEMTDFVTTANNITKARLLNYTEFNSESYVYKPINKGPTLTASGANARLKFYFERSKILKVINSQEAYEYMGFEKRDWQIVKSSDLVSETKMIYTCGNSICVEVLEQLFSQILKCLK
ncbi:DNA (cytosine-5-)-methyltransferase N-terminal subunit [Mycoplasma sp. 392]